MRPLYVESVDVRAFRNLSRVEVSLGERFNVVSGDNGHGKTNLLEGIYVLGSSKSFRASKLSEVVQFGADLASVTGRVVEDGDRRRQSVGIRAGQRAVRVED